ncbi:MAG: hypothetical protein HZB29_07685 [Nitrospinae bacterium]|nr:hypothetical protein [Nitrospinota bacterium]
MDRIGPRQTNAQNAEERHNLMVQMVQRLMRSGVRADEILPRAKGEVIWRLLRDGDRQSAANELEGVISELRSKYQYSGEAPEIKAAADRGAVMARQRTAFKPSREYDDGGFLWGTEGLFDLSQPGSGGGAQAEIINTVLQVKYVKGRYNQRAFTSADGAFTPEGCMPSPANCISKINLDELASIYRLNNWSMVPMLSADDSIGQITGDDIARFADFADWFVSRYKDTARIKYVEMVNDPTRYWKGSTAQLLKLANMSYDRLKAKYPDIMVGSPGFEYSFDSPDDPETAKMTQMVEYFLDRKNGAKFDFWAFHGYPALLRGKSVIEIYPPTKVPVYNKYAGVSGIMEIRKRMDENGWFDRLIIDTEHIGVRPGREKYSVEDSMVDASYMAQQLILKRTVRHNGSPALNGIITMKIYKKGDTHELWWNSLDEKGEVTPAVGGVGLLINRIREFVPSEHISGEYGADNIAWIEKFVSRQGGRELYVFFKPFKSAEADGPPVSAEQDKGRKGKMKTSIFRMDGGKTSYLLNLPGIPRSIKLTRLNGDELKLQPGLAITLTAENEPQLLEVNY